MKDIRIWNTCTGHKEPNATPSIYQTRLKTFSSPLLGHYLKTYLNSLRIEFKITLLSYAVNNHNVNYINTVITFVCSLFRECERDRWLVTRMCRLPHRNNLKMSCRTKKFFLRGVYCFRYRQEYSQLFV